MLPERYAMVQKRIATACEDAGRAVTDVGLIAVSKTFPLEDIQTVAQLGQIDFGESYAQELARKAEGLASARWHFIGRIQTNKAKYIAASAHRVHALETVRQAEALVRRAPTTLNALLSVNIAHEASKSGVLPAQALERIEALSTIEGLNVCGLMTLPPYTEDPEDSAPFFEELADLAKRGRQRGLPLDELSMGMSHDAHVAIRYGATWVRIGTAIFGGRS